MSPQEQFICSMADEIRAGRLIVTGDLSVRDYGHTYIDVMALDKPVKPPTLTLIAGSWRADVPSARQDPRRASELGPLVQPRRLAPPAAPHSVRLIRGQL
jgi:hypothetical protein